MRPIPLERRQRPVRAFLRTALVLALLSLPGGFAAQRAEAQIAEAIADCNQSADAERQIRGCTAFIAAGAQGRNLAIALANRGIAHYARDELALAVADFDAAIATAPDYAVAHYNRGLAHRDAGRAEQAVIDLGTALRLSPDDPDALDARGLAHMDLRQLADAVADFSRAIELDPGFAAAYYHRGLAYGRAGELALGRADYDKALELGCLRQGWCPPRAGAR